MEQIKMETFDGEYWGTVALNRHYRFYCPLHGNEDGHGFEIEGVVQAFLKFGKDYTEGVIYCTGKGCRATLPYRLTRVRK